MSDQISRKRRRHYTFLYNSMAFFQLPPLPDAAAGVVGAAQDGGVDVLFGEVLFHVGVISSRRHSRPAPAGVDDVIAVVGQAAGEADVGGAVDQNLVAPGADAVQCADDAAQHTVLVTDGLAVRPVTSLRVSCQRMMEP